MTDIRRRTLLQTLALASTAAALPAAPHAAAAKAGTPAADRRSGPLNLITDVPELRVGLAHDASVRTGTTVILPEAPAVAAVSVGGGGPATRETDALGEASLVQTVNAIVLSGGSVYGLAAADGVVAWLGERGIGYGLAAAGVPVAPIVPAACLYDLPNGGDKAWRRQPPYRELGIAAAQAAAIRFPLGTVGAGYGATTDKARGQPLKGGLGSASAVAGDGLTVGAIVAVNSLGSTTAAGSGAFWAAPYEFGHEFGGGGPAALHATTEDWAGGPPPDSGERKNTTIACIATDLALTRVELKRVAIMAHDGLARAIRPVHTPFDGDVVFAISTGRRQVQGDRQAATLRAGALAADTLARAVARGVYEASAWPGGNDVPTWKSRYAPG